MSKVILVTGASSGLGESVADFLSDRGYIVYGASRRIGAQTKNFTAITMDVTNEENVVEVVQQIIEREGRLDVLINNAGLGIAGPIENLLLADVLNVFDTNVLGIIRTCKAVLPYMRNNRKGLIINISSIAAEAGLPYFGVYGATKAAVDRITEDLRLELAPFNIQACYIQPGDIKTNINQNRLRANLAEGNEYRENFERTYILIDQSVANGLDPKIFGVLVEKIIHAKRVKRCYRVGRPLEKLSVLLKQLLPVKVYERMMLSYYNIK